MSVKLCTSSNLKAIHPYHLLPSPSVLTLGTAGITFHVEHRAAIDNIDQLTGVTSPIGCLVDGQHVREVQGPQGLPVVGSFYEVFPDHLGNHERLFRKYGSLIKTVNMGKTTYLTNSPEIAANVFAESPYMTKYINPSHPLFGLKDNTALFVGDTETDNWRLGHKFIPPALSPKAVKHYTPLMQDTVRASFKVFDELDKRNEAFNVYQYMLKLASQTIGKFAFGVDLHQFDDVDSPLHALVMHTASVLALNKKISARGEWYKSLPFGDPALLKNTHRKLYAMIQDAIDAVKMDESADLQLDDAALKASCVVDYLSRAVDSQGQKLPLNLILANMVIIFGAGFTTTSAALSWMIFSLVNYEGAQERLLQELVDSGMDGKRDWDADDIAKLSYLDSFVKETQRLHNPSFQVSSSPTETLSNLETDITSSRVAQPRWRVSCLRGIECLRTLSSFRQSMLSIRTRKSGMILTDSIRTAGTRPRSSSVIAAPTFHSPQDQGAVSDSTSLSKRSKSCFQSWFIATNSFARVMRPSNTIPSSNSSDLLISSLTLRRGLRGLKRVLDMRHRICFQIVNPSFFLNLLSPKTVNHSTTHLRFDLE